MNDSISYGLKRIEQGRTYSIDKFIIDYQVKSNVSFETICTEFSNASQIEIISDNQIAGYNSFFDKKPSSHYSWFRSSFWFPSVNVKYGLYHRNVMNNVWDIRQLIRLEFNPNKCFQDDAFIVLMTLIWKYCYCGSLVECDFTCDLLCDPNQVICNSLKDKVTYNDCRYYGKRHKHGRIKIYNKTREVYDKQKVKLDYQVTRCEITLKFGEAINFDEVCIYSDNENVKLSSNLKSIVSLIQYASSLGADMQDLVYRYVPDKRNRDKIFDAIYGSYHTVIFDISLFYEIMCEYANIYNFWFMFQYQDEKLSFNYPHESGIHI